MSIGKFIFDVFNPDNEDWEYYIQRFNIELSLHDGTDEKREQLLL